MHDEFFVVVKDFNERGPVLPLGKRVVLWLEVAQAAR